MRTILIKLDPQTFMTKDNVTIDVDGVMQCRIVDSRKSISNVVDVRGSLKEVGQLNIREELSQHDINYILGNREELVKKLLGGTQKLKDEWGAIVDSIRLKNIVFDKEMVRAMAKEAEAVRTAKAKVINADADVKTAKKYQAASAIYKEDPTAMRLRELEAFGRIAMEKSNTTILIPTQILDVLNELKK